MSRAFTKESDIVDLVLPEPAEYHITPQALRALQTEMRLCMDEKRRLAIARRLEIAVSVDPPSDRTKIAFGATVCVRDGDGSTYRYTIVDDSDFDMAAGHIGESSPLARALTGNRAGARVIWNRPIGPKTLAVDTVDYR